jgi:glycosyltransferase involved in cell wall biosynthesis
MKTTILITEDISEPIDEGVKKFSYQFAKFIDVNNNIIYCNLSNKNIYNIKYLPKNKFLFSFSFFKNVKLIKPHLIIYVPSSSSTLMGFIRLKIVSVFCRSAKMIMVSVQARKHNYITKGLIATFLKPDTIFALSNIEALYYEKLCITSFVSSVGVDVNKFNSINANDKNKLRQKLGLPLNAKILLHVGHIKKGRNLEILKILLNEGYKLVIIGSTRFKTEIEYKHSLEKAGYVFFNDYIENIEEFYQASDIYVFPVLSFLNAMEFPLSVLEAMSCNLPILTTRFGGLLDSFSESDCFKYFSDENELLEKINLLSKINICHNREIVLKNYSWKIVFNSLLKKVE